MGHLGSRVSLLLDGQLPAGEEERAWAHVHDCHECRDLVEREAWIKNRLAGLGRAADGAPDDLRGALRRPPLWDPADPARTAEHLPAGAASPRRGGSSILDRRTGAYALGGTALGAVVAGVVALGAAPAQGPVVEPAPADLAGVVRDAPGWRGLLPGTPLPSQEPRPGHRFVPVTGDGS